MEHDRVNIFWAETQNCFLACFDNLAYNYMIGKGDTREGALRDLEFIYFECTKHRDEAQKGLYGRNSG